MATAGTVAPQADPPIVRPPGESTTEYLLTSPDAFGIETATPAQRAVCRILDGVPLGDLAQHPDVIALVGGERGADAVAELPSVHGAQPAELVLLAAIRCAKTIMACAAAIRMALTVDISMLGDGETAVVSLLSLKLKKARVALKLIGKTLEKPKLRHLLIGEPTKESLWIKHPTGRAIEITVSAGAKAGGGLVSEWSAGVVFDEAPRMNGADDAVVNLDDARDAVMGRLLPGAQALYIGSPWAPFGPVFDMVEAGFEKPTEARVVLRGTGPMLNPKWWTPRRCESLQRRNPNAYATDVLSEFATPDGALFGADELKRATRDEEGDAPRALRGHYTAAMDPSDGTDDGNPWTLVIVERSVVLAPQTSPDGVPVLTKTGDPVLKPRNRFSVAAVREYRGMDSMDVLVDVAKVCGLYGLRSAHSDQYSGAALTSLAAQISFTLVASQWRPAEKVKAYLDLASYVKEGFCELHRDRQLHKDLASIRKRPKQGGGFTIVLPLMGGGRHCDYGPALARAIQVADVATGAVTPPAPVATPSRWHGMTGRGFG